MTSVVELYIDDDIVELGEDTIIALTRQVNNLGELKDRQTDFTNTFTIPKSSYNQKIFELSDDINSTSDKSYQKTSCKIVRDGVEIVQNALAVIESVKDNYEMTLYSGNANFFEEIGDKKLVDLIYLDVNTHWTRVEVINSLSATAGIFWPILDRGVFDNSEWADTRSMWPAIFVHDIIGYIFTAAGFNKAGDYLDSDDYKKLILPYLSIKVNDAVRYGMAARRYANDHYYVVPDGTGENTFYVKWESATMYDPYSLIRLKTGFWNFWRYWVPSNGFYHFHVNIVMNTRIGHGVMEFYLKTRRQDINIDADDYLDIYEIPANGQTDYDFVLEYKGDFLSQDCVYVEIRAFGTTGDYNINIEDGSQFRCVSVDCENTAFGCQVPCGINLPDMTQKDLLKALAWMHCILFITDNITKTVHFIKFSDIIKNKRIAHDWSDKLDLSKDREPELKFKFGKYGQTNYLKYKEDEDVELELGDDSFVFDDKTLPLEKTLIEMPFAATNSRTCLKGINTAIIKCQEINKIHILDLDDGLMYHSIDGLHWILTELEYIDSPTWFYQGEDDNGSSGVNAKFDEPIIIDKQISPRILAVEKVVDVGDDIKFYEGKKEDFTGKDDNINVAYFIHPFYGDISFNGLIDDHYQEFINTMNKPKVLTAYFKLSPIDILNFNFAIPVWIDYYQSYFYVNKIEEYRGEITKVELIKI